MYNSQEVANISSKSIYMYGYFLVELILVCKLNYLHICMYVQITCDNKHTQIQGSTNCYSETYAKYGDV